MTATETEARGLRLSVPTYASGREPLIASAMLSRNPRILFTPATGRLGFLDARGCLI